MHHYTLHYIGLSHVHGFHIARTNVIGDPVHACLIVTIFAFLVFANAVKCTYYYCNMVDDC
jgi:hypothetical protein